MLADMWSLSSRISKPARPYSVPLLRKVSEFSRQSLASLLLFLLEVFGEVWLQILLPL
jgi:hypothetical protein